MRRDTVLWSALRARQRPTAQLGWVIDPRDETDPAECEGAKLITEIVEDIPRFQKLKMQLLEALWFGKYATEAVYRWENHNGRTCLKVVDHIPIMGDTDTTVFSLQCALHTPRGQASEPSAVPRGKPARRPALRWQVDCATLSRGRGKKKKNEEKKKLKIMDFHGISDLRYESYTS